MEIEYKQEGSIFRIDVICSPKEVEQELDEVAKVIRPHVAPAGFRKNSAPLNVIKRYYRKHCLAEAATKLVFEASQHCLKQKQFRNALNPQLGPDSRPTETKKHAGDFRLDGTFYCQLELEVPPALTPVGYHDIEVKVPIASMQSWLDRHLREKQIQYGSQTEVERPIAMSDWISIDYAVMDKTENANILSTEESYVFVVGSNTFTSDVETALIGKSKNDEIFVTNAFGSNHEKHAGQVLPINIKIRQVYDTQQAPLDDALAHILGAESLDAYIELQKQVWKRDYEKPVEAQIYSVILDKLLELNPFEVPQSWIDNEYQLTWRRMGLSEAPVDRKMRQAVTEIAEKTVKTAYLLDKIYEQEPDIVLTPEEVRQGFATNAEQQSMMIDDLIEKLRINGQYDAFIAYMEHTKTMKYLLQQAKIQEA